MLKKLMQSAAALALTVGIVAASTQEADAHRRNRGLGAGIAIGTILGLGIAGAYAGPRYHGYYDGPACYPGPRTCGHVGRSCWFNAYGERVCRGGEYRCWRAQVCD
jgi:hypothetical protein